MFYEIIAQSFIAGFATVLGAMIVILTGQPTQKMLSGFLGFAAGVMSAVVALDLLPSALILGNMLLSSCGFLIGLIFMRLLDLVVSLLAIDSTEKILSGNNLIKMGYLIATGIALHNLPEGMAIAGGYSAHDNLGIIIALSIGLHNIPEGMATAAPLTMGGMSKIKVVIICFLISVFTPIGAYIGLLLVNISAQFICILLSLAGGAMTFIIINELIPESYHQEPRSGLLGFIIGFALIVILGLLHG